MWREFRPNQKRQSLAMLNIKTRRLLIVISFLVALALAQDAIRLTAAEAENHIGENATVCGKVASTYYAFTKGRRPTFLNIDKPYPYEIFTPGRNAEALIVADKIEQKYGTIPLELAGNDPRFKALERMLRKLSDEQVVNLTATAADMQHRNRMSG
jgi:hypothetical protein